MRLVLYAEPRSSSLPVLPANPCIQRQPTKSHGMTMRTSSWSIHVRRDASTRTIARDWQEAVDVYLRLYEPWGCTLSTSEALVANNLHNHETNLSSYTMSRRINRHTRMVAQRQPYHGTTCTGNIRRNHKCLPPRDRQQSSGTLPLTPTINFLQV